ncbi:MAG: type II secretion system major pseudopilin GspG [Phycisphaerales bacterium]
MTNRPSPRRRTTQRNRPARRGFTLIEIIVVVVIIGVLAAVIAPRIFSRIGQSKTAVATSNASSLVSAMRLFIADHGMPPEGSTIDVLWEKPSFANESAWSANAPYVESADALLDPWGNKFLLVIPGSKNVDFDIVSYGRDAQPGGEGEDADVVRP